MITVLGTDMPEAGKTVDDYRLRGLLHPTGAVSQVYEVIDAHNLHYAMKILLPEAAKNPTIRAQLFNEAEVGIKLRHENVIRILKVSRSKEHPYFIMEFFPSGSLRTKLRAKEFDFIKQNARSIFKQASTALAYMHGSGWTHCDIKPDNLLVNARGELRVIDFAISKRIPTGLAKWLYRRKKGEGTLSFMSPEQLKGEMPDPRSDIYSLGATFYELLTGRPPFRAATAQELMQKQVAAKPDSPQAHNPDVTREMSALVLEMLAKNKEDRPQSCHDVMIAMRGLKIFNSEQFG